MSNLSDSIFFSAVLKDVFFRPIEVKNTSIISGGCINNALKLKTSEGNYFLKWQIGIPEDMFQKEAQGLKFLKANGNIKIPKVFAFGKIEERHYLFLEHIESASP